MSKVLNSIFDRDYMMHRSLKFIDDKRKILANDHPVKYWLLNQDLYINITVFLWLIWQAWSLSAIFSTPTPTFTNPNADYNYYLATVFWKIGTLNNNSLQNSDIIFVEFSLDSYIYSGFTIVLILFTIYTIAVSNRYIHEIKTVIQVNKINVWKYKINTFLVVIHLFIFYGLVCIIWIIISIFYIPNAKASEGFENLIYVIGPKDTIKKDLIVFNNTGLVLTIAVCVNLAILLSLYLYYLHHRFVGYRSFFAFEKKQWKKIDYVGETISYRQRRKLKALNKAQKGSFKSVNNPGYVIELKNINKYFLSNGLQFHALKDVNLQIQKGEFVVILGPSGSGKTTLLNIVSGVDRPTTGEIVVANNNIIKMNSVQLTKFRKEKTGYIFQQYSLLPNLNVRENISIGHYLGQTRIKALNRQNFFNQLKQNRQIGIKIKILFGYIKTILLSHGAKNKLIDDVIELLGLSEHATKYPSQLSGGQQQRVAIARSFVKQPDILFGDEPTGAIDVEMSKKILEIFYTINHVTKTTVLMVTHNPIIAEMATRVIEVHNGVITKNVINQFPKRVHELKWD